MSGLFKNKWNKKLVVSAVAILSAALLNAQDAPVAAVTSPSVYSSPDMLWCIIISIAAALLFAILILSRVMLNLLSMVIKKNNIGKVVSVIAFLLLASDVFAEATNAASTGPEGPTTWNWNLILAGTFLLTEVGVIAVLLLRILSLINELSGKKSRPALNFHMPKLLEKLNASVPVEQEADVMLDHNYDGIRELDNNLPPWWKYGFYFTIVYAFVYLFYFHVAGGPTSLDEYNTEMEDAKIAKDEYMLKNALNVDENSVKMADAMGINEGQGIFTTNCAACHGAKAEGTVGPNLTDDYWLHGGSLPDVFKSVKYGWPAKGMKSWQTDLSPVQMKNVVSYIKTLQGTTPANAKAPQGDLYKEAMDSTAVAIKADTTAVKQ